MKKRIFSTVLILLLFFSITINSVNAQKPITIKVNNKEVKTDADPFIKDNRTMVPIRFIVEALGGSANYFTNDEYGGIPYVVVSNSNPEDGLSMILFINKHVAMISQGTFRSDVAPLIRNNRTFVPLRFAADYLNFDVEWDGNTNTVYLNSSNSQNDKMEKYFDEAASNRLQEVLSGSSQENIWEYVLN